MGIELRRVELRDLVVGYVDDAELGITVFGGRLDVRPADSPGQSPWNQ